MLSVVYFMLLFVSALSVSAVDPDPMVDCPIRCDCLDSYVDCSEKMLISLPETLPLWTKDLDLSSNKIEGSLKFESDSYFQLSTLRLNKNFIMFFPFFLNTTSITHLNLAHNKITKIDSIALKNLPILKHLDMNKNKLLYLDNNTFPMSNHLRILNLNNNLISNINFDALDTLTHLVDLKLSHNRLVNVPREIFKNLGNLEVLDLSRNEISVIEGLIFSELTNLKSLILRKNIIEDLRAGAFFNLRNLLSLYLEGNSLNKVSKNWLYGLTSLVYLNISFNKIDNIESGWDNCQYLEELDLSHNKLHFIDKTDLENLKNLQKLYLNNNRLAFIEDGSFKHTPLLQTLVLDQNHLASTIEDKFDPFNGLTNLKTLSLANNEILYIKRDAFYGLDNLEDLNLFQNNILEVQEEVLKCLPNLARLSLNSTSLVCDCSLSWIKESNIFEHLPFNLISMICGFPEKNRGKSVDEVPLKDFLCLQNSPKPMITFQPESKMVLEGQNITLKCGVNSSSTEKISFIWKKDNHDLELISELYYLSFESIGVTQFSILNFYNILMSEGGQYQCIASNQFGISYSNRSTLSVVIFPYFTKIPRNSSVKIGYKARLECAASGYPTPQISWQKDGGNEFPAAQERRMKVISQDNVFLIVNAKLVDMGIYSCIAKNIAGMIAVNVTLTILEPPWFGNIMFKKQVNAGEEVVLECLSYGSPKPRVKWKKDSIPVIVDDRHVFTAEDQVLVIKKTNQDDSGTYECEISNSLGSKIQEVEVLIMTPLNQSFVQKYIVRFVIVMIILFIIIISAIRIFFVCRTKSNSSSSNLINIDDNKSLNSTNSQDSGNRESIKKSQELYNKTLNIDQELNTNKSNLLPEITSPLIIPGSVVLGENSVQYKHSQIATMPVQLSIDKPSVNVENSATSCSIPFCSTNGSPSIVQHSDSYECLYMRNENP